MHFAAQSTFRYKKTNNNNHMKSRPQNAEPLIEYLTSIKKNKSNYALRFGYLFLIVSFFLFTVVESLGNVREDADFTIFFIHYIVALAYVVVLAVNGSFGLRKSWRIENLDKTIVLLNLFLISAFALNRAVGVFAESTDWLCFYLMVTCLVLLSYRYFHRLPFWINRLQLLTIGSAVIFYIYEAAYVAELYAVGTVGILFLGIGAHIFVPLTFLTATLFLISHSIKKRKGSPYWITAGSVGTVVVVLIFMGEWNSRIAQIERITNQSVIYGQNGLPEWVNVAKHVKKDWISERIIKSDMAYAVRNPDTGWDAFRFSLRWDEQKKHDPLVFISSLVARCSLPFDDRVKILQALFADRHKATERLWSGDNLATSYILSDVDIYPGLRIAYVEKYLNVRNNATSDNWNGNTEEAIYTFQLPEGSVTTSLSLWIEGKEEKGILTSKQKATNAYKTIVGVERRDPSVIHWQEGNTVTVRVFPCTPEEERKFKIGFTCPLSEKAGDIIFKNISFQGPSPSKSRETFRIRFIGEQPDVNLPRFERDGNGDYVTEHIYDPNFTFTFKAQPIPPNQFTFQNYTYCVRPYEPSFRTVSYRNVFLDINSSWTDAELQTVEKWLSTRQLFVVTQDGFNRVTKENWDKVVAPLHNQNFSVFPFNDLNDDDESLVITKGTRASPHLADFKDTEFSNAISQYFSSGKRAAVYNIDGQISTYVSSLREFRAIDFATGDLEQLDRWLRAEKFPLTGESSARIVLHDSNLIIEKINSEKISVNSNTAPDHIARLFAYNDIMRKVGVGYFDNSFINDELVAQAASAYVVSPVSSLIVLETQKDYERFGIEESLNSLHNAVKNSTGAVPEPHEWAIIICFGMFLLYLKVRRVNSQPV
jgi:XrtN system VIT domain protein